MVTYEGRVAMCCMDWGAKHPVGYANDKALKNIDDYKNVFDNYNSPENFYFIDQPYDSTFNDYGTDNFTRQNQQELFQKFSTTSSKCLMIVGGSDFIRDLYQDYIVHEYPKKYSFKIYAGRVGDEINVNHLVIKNY